MSDFDINVGDRIKKLRVERNMTLQDVANFTGFSKALISQIENGVVTPPINTLSKIAKVLNVKMVYFFEEELSYQDYYVVKNDNRKYAFREGAKHGYLYEELAHMKNNDLFESFIVTIKSVQKEKKLFSHDGYELMYILDGHIKMYLNNDLVELKSGDSIAFSSKIPHYAESVAPVESKIISIRIKSPEIRSSAASSKKSKLE